MADSPVATTHVREDAASPARSPAAPEGAAPDAAAEAGAQAIVRAFHAATGAAGSPHGAPSNGQASWGTRAGRATGRDLVALQRLAGNRAVASLVGHRSPGPGSSSHRQLGVRPTIQRQPTPTKADVKPTPQTSKQANPEPYALEYMGATMQAAVNALIGDITIDAKIDLIVVGIQPKSITIFGRDKRLLTGPLEMQLPEGVRPVPGVYLGPSLKVSKERKQYTPIQQVLVDPGSKNWVPGGYTSFLKAPDPKDGTTKATAGPGTPAKDASAAPPGNPAPIKAKADATAPGQGPDKDTTPGAADPTKAKAPPKILSLLNYVKDVASVDRVLQAHEDALQFFLVPTPPSGGRGKKGGGSTTGFAGEVEGQGQPPNAPPWPVTMDGPKLQPADSDGAFSSRINWAANGNDASSSQVIAAIGNDIHYRWEMFDITKFAKANEEKLAVQARQTRAVLKAADQKTIGADVPKATAAGDVTQPKAAANATPQPADPGTRAVVDPPTKGGNQPDEKSYEEIKDDLTHSSAGSGNDPTAATRNRKFRRSFEELWDDTARAGKDLADPSGSTTFERQSNAQANMLAIELMPVSAVITALGSSLRWFADLFAGEQSNQEINFPNEGVFLVRVITTPAVTTNKEGEEIRRPSSVASKVVEVVKMGRMIKEALDDPAAQLAQADADLASATASKDADRIKAAQEARDLKALEIGGNPVEYIELKLKIKRRELEAARKKWEGVAVGPILDIQNEIDVLENREKVFILQEQRRASGKQFYIPSKRVNASLVSEVTGQTYPLMLSVGPTHSDDGRHTWKILDATSEDSEGFTGYGTTKALALEDAFRQFGNKAQFGRGTIGVRIPPDVDIEPGARHEYTVPSKPLGWAIAKGRIDDLVMTLAALGLIVASAGTASVAIGAAVAAARLVDRWYNGTLRFDAAAVSDVLAILGAVGAGAHAAAEFGVAAAGVKFKKIGDMMVMLEEGANVSAADFRAAEAAFAKATGVLNKVEKANEILNYAGVIWGNVTFFNDMAETAELEAKGPENGGITHAEARRRRASGLAGAINNNGMAIAPHVIGKLKEARAARESKTGAPSESKGPTGLAEPTPKPEVAAGGTAGGTGEPKTRPGETTTKPAESGGKPTEAGPSTEKPGDSASKPGETTPNPGEPAVRPGDHAPGSKHAGEGGGIKVAATAGGGEHAGTRPEPKPGSAQERAAVHKALQDAARGNGDLNAAAEAAIGKGGTWKEGLKKALSGLEGDHRIAAEKALVEARERIVNEEWKKLQDVNPEAYGDLRLENAGTKSFTSDIDATVRPKTEANVLGSDMAGQVERSAKAAQELSDALRKRVGGETDALIDTNIYSFIGEGRTTSADPKAKGAKSHVDVVVGLAEQLRGQGEAGFRAFEKSLGRKLGDPRVGAEAKALLGEAREFHKARETEWRKALDDAGVRPGSEGDPAQQRMAREKILGEKKADLGKLLAADAPDHGAITRKQAEINWFAPDAYATPSAFQQAVAHGQRLKGAARTAAEWKGTEVATKLREQAGKLRADDPRAQKMQRDAGLVEHQQATLDEIVKDIKRANDNPPVDARQVKELEAYADGLRKSIAEAAEPFVVSQILGETAPAGRPGRERISEAAAASGANMGMLESHVAHAKDVDGKVKAAAKYAGRIAMAEFLGGLRPGSGPIERLLGDFVQSRWGIFEDAAPTVLRDMFLRYAELKGRSKEIVRDARGEPVGVSDAVKQAFVDDVTAWARSTNQGIQTAAIGAKAFDNPTAGTASLPGHGEPTPAPKSEATDVPNPATGTGETAGRPAQADQGTAGGAAGSRSEHGPEGGGIEPPGRRPGSDGGAEEPAGSPHGPGGGPEGPAAQAESEAAAEINRLRQRLYRWRAQTNDAASNRTIDVHLAELRELAASLRKGEAVEGRLAGLREALPEHRRALRPVDADSIQALRSRVERRRERSRDREAIREMDRLLAEIDALRGRLEADPKADVRAAYDVLRRQAGRAGRQDYEVFVDLTDPATKGELFHWFSEALTPLASGTIGQVLNDMILSHIDTADALVLQQSPRQAGTPVRDTAAMRPLVRDAVRAGKYPPEYVAAFESAARGQPDDWPRTPDGRAWEVDHVAELWMGGADDATNYLALPEYLHDAKSDILTRFRREYREGTLVRGEQVDLRERD